MRRRYRAGGGIDRESDHWMRGLFVFCQRSFMPVDRDVNLFENKNIEQNSLLFFGAYFCLAFGNLDFLFLLPAFISDAARITERRHLRQVF